MYNWSQSLSAFCFTEVFHLKLPRALSIAIILLVAVQFGAISQSTVQTNFKNVFNPVYPSPTASSLGKYADIPVSYHTGVPNISVPLYTINEGDLSLPVSVSYHAAGIRVDEISSPVGLGWSLNAGGMISRTVNGGPDEGYTHSKAMTPKAGWGWYKDGNFPNEIIYCENNSWDAWRMYNAVDSTSCEINNNCLPCVTWYHDAALGAIDLEPDLYSFNVNGYSGKFFFDANKKAHFINATDIHVEPINSPSYFSAWRLITPDGVKYYFGNYSGVNATEKSYADPNGVFADFYDLVANTTWYLTRIESPSGNSWIKIEYEDEYYCFGNRKGQTYYHTVPGQNVATSDYVLAVSYVQGKRIKRITTSSGGTIVDFIASANGREDINYSTASRANDLSANSTAKYITAVDVNAYGLHKRFDFGQDYFVSSAQCFGCLTYSPYDATQHKKRLRLNTITETDGTNHLPPYTFLYNTSIPWRYSLARDGQGYYNGKESNDGWFHNGTQMANYSPPLTTGDDHLPDITYMKAGTLYQMTHPLGRVTVFDFEAHSTGSTTIGGLRIKTITEQDAGATAITRQFSYQEPKLYFDNNPNYGPFVDQDNIINSTLPSSNGMYMEYFNSAPVVPMYSPLGYSIAYDKVTETQPGNGSTIYSYYSFAPTFPSGARNFPDVPVVTTSGSGDLKSKDIKTQGNITVSLSETTKQQIGTPAQVVARRVGIANRMNESKPHPLLLGYPFYQDYTITSGRFLTTIEKQTDNGVLSQVNYTYDANPLHNGPRTIEKVGSNLSTFKTEFVYASDAGSGAPNTMYFPLHSDFKNMLGTVVEEREYVNNVLLRKGTNQYTQIGPHLNLTSSKIYPNGGSEFVESQLVFNDAGKVINATQSNGGVPKGYQWGYSNTLPIAEVTNASNTKRSNFTYGTTTESVSGNQMTPYTISKTFTVGAFGTVVLSLGRTTNPGSNNIYADYSGTLGSGTLTLTYFPQCGQTAAYFNNVVPGTYTINITIRTTPVNMTMNVCGEIQYPAAPTTTITGITEFFYESFEEGSATGTATPHTGKKYLLGDYTTTFTKPNTRTYTIEYWYLNGSTWTYASTTYTNGMILTNGSAIDNVRIYPADARMKSYTFDPALGITSVIDENAAVQFYEYDTFGRLAQVKDDKGHIVQQNTYNYKTN